MGIIKVRSFIDKIPIWVYNLLTLIYAIIAIATPIIAGVTYLVNYIKGKENTHIAWPLICLGLIAVIFILIFRASKYRSLSR